MTTVRHTDVQDWRGLDFLCGAQVGCVDSWYFARLAGGPPGLSWTELAGPFAELAGAEHAALGLALARYRLIDRPDRVERRDILALTWRVAEWLGMSEGEREMARL